MVNKSEAIKIKNADFGYKKSNQITSVLKNCDAEFNYNDFVAVVGDNGSGKSTLLKTIAGLNPILKGDVLLDCKNIKELSVKKISELISIALTQKVNGFNLTCYDLVALGQIQNTNIFNQLNATSKQLVDTAIQNCHLKAHRHKLLSELSDGLFQKTIIAKCLAQQSPIMLLDEPSAFLDFTSKHELFLLLKNLANKNNNCVLVSTHELDLALKYCDKILIVANETIQLFTVHEAKKSDLFKKLSGGFITI